MHITYLYKAPSIKAIITHHSLGLNKQNFMNRVYSIFIIFLFICKSDSKAQYTIPNHDTVYIIDYFGIDYKESFLPNYPHSISYRGSTTVYFPKGDSVVLQTKLINRMPNEIDQYVMLRIVKPKNQSLKLRVKFEQLSRKGIITSSCDTLLELKPLKRPYSFYFGRIHERKRVPRSVVRSDCGLQMINSDMITNYFYRQIIKGNIERGVTHIYYAETGELIENPVYYN
jgi:hypothetical protein